MPNIDPDILMMALLLFHSQQLWQENDTYHESSCLPPVGHESTSFPQKGFLTSPCFTNNVMHSYSRPLLTTTQDFSFSFVWLIGWCKNQECTRWLQIPLNKARNWVIFFFSILMMAEKKEAQSKIHGSFSLFSMLCSNLKCQKQLWFFYERLWHHLFA